MLESSPVGRRCRGREQGCHRDDRELASLERTSEVINPHTQAALARQRRDSLLAEAEAARRAGHGRRAGRRVLLRDGSAVLIRPVHRTDAPLVAAAFRRLSAHSRRMRFLTRKDELSAAELRYFTDLDHHDHEALGAVSHPDGRGVGVARYVRDAADPRAAEIALTIVDDWQGRGLGTELLAQLSSRARHEGVRRFTALVSADNTAMSALLRNAGAELVRREPGAVEYEITLMPGGEPPPGGRAARPDGRAEPPPGGRAARPGGRAEPPVTCPAPG
jgi:RimJ/RimL family protein N-acetyltransferase